jgi:hypothetical protein
MGFCFIPFGCKRLVISSDYPNQFREQPGCCPVGMECPFLRDEATLGMESIAVAKIKHISAAPLPTMYASRGA